MPRTQRSSAASLLAPASAAWLVAACAGGIVFGQNAGAPGAATPPTAPATPAPAAPAASAAVVVVTASEAALRSGNAYTFYPVATLKTGQTLKLEGESGGYFRVAYPAGTRAFVKVDDVQADAAGKTVKLTRPSKLLAANATTGIRASWNSLMERELAPGTELAVLEAMKDDAGKVTHYAVAAPAGAVGFVDKSAVRRASAEEAAAFLQSTGQPAGQPTGQPTDQAAGGAGASAPAPAVPAPSPTPPPPGASTGASAGSPPIGTLNPPAVPPAPVDAGAANPPPAGRLVPVLPDGQPARVEPPVAPPPAPAPAPVAPAPTRAERILEIFNRVRAQPLMEAEFDEALRQMEGFKASLGDGPVDRRLAQRIDGLMNALRLRKDLRDETLANDKAVAEIDARKSGLSVQIAELEKQRVYNVIGRVVPSVVFDGGGLPRLYRIQSPEPGTARTLGYIADDPKLDLAGKIGLVVGVLGETQFDETLRANMIVPRRVDVVSLAPVRTLPPGEPPAPEGQ